MTERAGFLTPSTALKLSSSRISFAVGALAPRRGVGPLNSHETADVRHGLEKLAGALGFDRPSPSWMALARSSFVHLGGVGRRAGRGRATVLPFSSYKRGMRTPLQTRVPLPVRVPPRLRLMLTPPRPLTEVQAEAEKSRRFSRLCPETALIEICTRDVGEGCQRLHLRKEIQADMTGPGLRVFNAEADTLAMSRLR